MNVCIFLHVHCLYCTLSILRLSRSSRNTRPNPSDMLLFRSQGPVIEYSLMAEYFMTGPDFEQTASLPRESRKLTLANTLLDNLNGSGIGCHTQREPPPHGTQVPGFCSDTLCLPVSSFLSTHTAEYLTKD